MCRCYSWLSNIKQRCDDYTDMTRFLELGCDIFFIKDVMVIPPWLDPASLSVLFFYKRVPVNTCVLFPGPSSCHMSKALFHHSAPPACRKIGQRTTHGPRATDCTIVFSYRVFRRISKISKKRLLASSRLSVRPSLFPYGTSRLSLDGFPWNLTYEYFFVNLPREFTFH